MTIHQNFSLQRYNTFGINASCGYFAEVKTIAELQEVLVARQFINTEKFILGGGSNILLTRDFPGLVIKISMKGIEVEKENNEHIWVKASAGEVWHELVLFCIRNNFAGVENLSLIPGLAGAAPMQNIGAYGVELESVFESLEAVHIGTGTTKTFSKKDCEFGYRESIFKKSLKGQVVITSITLKLNRQPSLNISYGAIRDTLEKSGVKDLTIKAISDAVIAIRSSKLPDPAELGNAGSFFKNPEISQHEFQRLKNTYPEIPNYPQASGTVKIPAGWLIEQCGWKGKKVGNTGSHKDQALVLVNYGNATGNEIYSLAEKISDSVQEKFGVAITPEVNIV